MASPLVAPAVAWAKWMRAVVLMSVFFGTLWDRHLGELGDAGTNGNGAIWRSSIRRSLKIADESRQEFSVGHRSSKGTGTQAMERRCGLTPTTARRRRFSGPGDQWSEKPFTSVIVDEAGEPSSCVKHLEPLGCAAMRPVERDGTRRRGGPWEGLH